MQRRYTFALATTVLLGLMALMINVDAHAQIAFVSEKHGNREIYVMDANGNNHRRITNNFWDDSDPKWFSPIFSVVPAGKTLTTWGWFKQGPR